MQNVIRGIKADIKNGKTKLSLCW